MKCPQCGGAMRTKKENFAYKACGLPNVTLMGIQVRRCVSCGEYEAEIPGIERLHRAIAAMIIRKRTRLVPAEIRFLRKLLGWSGDEFAQRMRVERETVSRWEQGAVPIGPQADALLRMCVAYESPIRDYSSEQLKVSTKTQKTEPTRVKVKMTKGEWEPQAA